MEPVGGIVEWQAGNIDPAMEALEGAIVVGKRKAVTSDRSRFGEKAKAAASFEALIREPEKTVFGEQRSESSGAPGRESSVPCMPVMGEAVTQITWNLFCLGRASHLHRVAVCSLCSATYFPRNSENAVCSATRA